VVRHLAAGTIGDFFMPLRAPDFVLAILYLGVLSTLVSSMITNFILSKLEAAKMSVFSNLGTLITMAAGVFLLKEEMFNYHIIGSVLIIAGVLGTNFLDDRRIKGRAVESVEGKSKSDL